MNTLSIPITSIGEAGYALDERVPISSVQPAGVHSLPIETVSVSGRFDCMGEEFLFRGRVSGAFSEPCCRCLAPAQAFFDVEVAWVFTEGPAATFEELGHLDAEDEDAALENESAADTPKRFQGHSIDLAPYVWEEVVFAVPSRYLCDPSCQGLCLRCGANLNREACRCAPESPEEPIGNRGLANLATLFPDLAPKTFKE